MSNHWVINWLVIENSLESITNLWHWLLIDVACVASVSTWVRLERAKKKEQELDWKRLLWRLSLLSSMGNWCIRLRIDYLTIIYRFHWCHWCHRLDTSVGVTFNCYVPFPPRNFFTQTSILFILCGRPSLHWSRAKRSTWIKIMDREFSTAHLPRQLTRDWNA